MKLATVTQEIHTNLTGGRQMRISQSAKMFEAIAALYSDVPKAIIRELVANMVDAHLMNGQRRPWRVALPSVASPAIAFRDFGPGMPPEFMDDGYLVVGHSTKNDDNGQIGGYGFGRLAPLAYKSAKTYTVTTFIEGVKRIYLVFKDELQIPTVNLIVEELTEEPDGTEVIVPVADQDRTRFEERVQEVLKWFDPADYEVFGTTITPVAFNLKSATYYETSGLNRSWCLMGPIAYQIDWGQIGESLPNSIVPIFEIGELDLVPSRESVAYGPLTLAAMKARYQQIVDDIAPRALEAAETMTPAERLHLVDSLRDGGLAKVFDAYHKARGHRAADEEAEKAYRNKTGDLFGFRRTWGTFLKREHERILIQAPWRTYFKNTRGRSKATYSNKPSSGQEIEFQYKRDLEQQACFLLMDVEDANPRIYDRIENSSLSKNVTIIWDAKAFAQLEELKPASEFHLLSDFQAPPKLSRRYAALHAVYTNGSYREESGVLPTSGVYLPFDGKNPDYRSRYSWSYFVGMAWAKEITFYGLNKTARSKVKLASFVRLDDWIMEKARTALKDPQVLRALSAANILEQAQNSVAFRAVSHREATGQIQGPMQKAVDALRKLRADIAASNGPTLETLKQLRNMGEITLPKVKDFHRLLPALDQVNRRNPVLKLISDLQDRRVYDAFASAEHKEILEKLLK